MALVPFGIHESAPASVRGGVVAVGNFDGVHRGHASLITTARSLAGPEGIVVPVTFDPHPLMLLAPERYQPPLTTISERSRLLHMLGANEVVVLRTTRELLALSPGAFFDNVIRRGLAARGLVEGFNFRFGRDRAGSNDTLRSLCAATGLTFREVPALEDGGRPVSSSRIRDAILAGDLAMAASLLGRPYRVVGQIGIGAKRGRTIGFPTANLNRIETILPLIGVYAAQVELNGKTYPAAANIGPNPTFGEQVYKVEVHLIDFAGDLYGREIAVDFLGRIRETKRFASVEALIEQLKSDVAAAKKVFHSVG